MSKTTNMFSPEVRERAVRMDLGNQGQHGSRWQRWRRRSTGYQSALNNRVRRAMLACEGAFRAR